MIDIRKVIYNTVLLTASGTAYNMDDVLQGVSWEENPGELAQRGNFSFANSCLFHHEPLRWGPKKYPILFERKRSLAQSCLACVIALSCQV
jgi:hypothetical protein